MKQNMSAIDRWIRAIVGILILALVFGGPRSAWGYVGLVPLFTAIVGFCPAYRVFGWSTKRPVSPSPV